MKKIYKTYLRKWGACEPQIELFNKHYPKGINVCDECFKEAAEKGLRVPWLVYKVMRLREGAKYFSYRDKYLEWDVYGIRFVTPLGYRWLEKTLLDLERP